MTVTYDASRVTLVDHPLVQHKLSILRDKNTGSDAGNGWKTDRDPASGHDVP